jgi:hypothetical protein
VGRRMGSSSTLTTSAVGSSLPSIAHLVCSCTLKHIFFRRRTWAWEGPRLLLLLSKLFLELGSQELAYGYIPMASTPVEGLLA